MYALINELEDRENVYYSTNLWNGRGIFGRGRRVCRNGNGRFGSEVSFFFIFFDKFNGKIFLSRSWFLLFVRLFVIFGFCGLVLVGCCFYR